MMKNWKKSLRRDLEKEFSTLSRHELPGGLSLAVSFLADEGVERFRYVSGYTEIVEKITPVSTRTFFDLASLTKPLVTALSLFGLMERGKVRLTSRLGDLLSTESVPVDKKSIQLYQLLSHCSGLAAHRNYYVKMLGLPPDQRKQFIVNYILAEKLEYTTGCKHLYSDLGYILLGYIVEKITGDRIDRYFEENIAKPLGIDDELFFKYLQKKTGVAPCAATEICPWTHTLLEGIVHDDNCRAMGGVAGHAGLFGTAEAVLKVCEYIMKVWRGESDEMLFKQRSLVAYLQKVNRSTWTCGFDTPSALYSSSGKYFSKNSIGHLGYTGTSFWIDLDRSISVVFLTNRVHPTRKNEYIRRLRPRIHNLVMENLIR